MSNNRIRYLIISIITILLLLLIISTIFYLVRRREHRPIPDESCPRPNQYATNYDFDYTTRSHEYQNANGSVDYFRLSLSWSPTFCSKLNHTADVFQCQHRFGFIVHGLWPNAFNRNNLSPFSYKHHPRNCRNEQPMSPEIIRKYFCLMPSETLMQAEWEKHGTCYWKKPEDYFEQIKYLYSKIHLPTNIDDISNNQTLSKRERRKVIKQSFLDINPQLKSNEIDVMISQGTKLKEVAFCYDRTFNHTKCY